MTLNKTNTVTQSIANIAKCVTSIIGVAIVLGKTLDPIKLFRYGIVIGGVFMCSAIDQLLAAQVE